MSDHDFIAAMSKGIPQITPSKGWEPVTHRDYDPRPNSAGDQFDFELSPADSAIAAQAKQQIEEHRIRLNALDALSRRSKP